MPKKALTKEKIKHKKVRSSNVASYGYSEKDEVLEVKYLKATGEQPVYQFHPVTSAMFKDLESAPSKGTWMHRNIRQNERIESVKISGG